MVSVKAVGRFAFAKALSCKTFFIEGQKLLYFILPAGEYIKETLVVDLYLHIQELHKSSFTTSIKLISESVSKRDRQLSDSGHITRSSWLNCALRDDEAVFWASIGHYETVAVSNW